MDFKGQHSFQADSQNSISRIINENQNEQDILFQDDESDNQLEGLNEVVHFGNNDEVDFRLSQEADRSQRKTVDEINMNFPEKDLEQLDSNLFNQSKQREEIISQIEESQRVSNSNQLLQYEENNQVITNRESINNSDSDYELCFVVEDVEFLTYKQGFISHSQYFRDLLTTVQDTQIRILLPLWATANSFRIVLDFVNTGEIAPDIDIHTMQNVLWLADFFQIHQLQRLAIDNYILPQLTKNNVLIFLEDSFSKLSSCQEQYQKLQQEASLGLTSGNTIDDQINQYFMAEDIWYDFFNQCIEISALNMEYLVKFKDRDLLALPDSIVEEIIERSLKIKRSTEDQQLVRFLMRLKKTASVYDLLEIEKNRVIQTYEKLIQSKVPSADNQQQQVPLLSNYQTNQTKPLLTWKLQNLNMKQNFYKESDAFIVDNIQYILFISKTNDKECQIGMKYHQNTDNLTSQRQDLAFYPRYSFLSFLNWVRLDSEASLYNTLLQSQQQHFNDDMEHESLVKIASMILSPSKSSTVLRVIPIQLIEQKMLTTNLNVEVFFQVKHSIATILNFLSQNFSLIGKDLNFQKLDSSELSLMLTHRKLDARSEDDVVDSVILWLKRNIALTREKDLVYIMNQINWPYVSFDKLIDIFRQFQPLRKIPQIKSIFYQQVHERATKKSTTITQPPRMSYQSVMIETFFDYKYFLDKMADFMFKVFESGLEAQLMSPISQVTLSFKACQQKNQALNMNSDLQDTIKKSIVSQSQNKSFLEEQYYMKLQEINEIKKQLNLKSISKLKRNGQQVPLGQVNEFISSSQKLLSPISNKAPHSIKINDLVSNNSPSKQQQQTKKFKKRRDSGYQADSKTRDKNNLNRSQNDIKRKNENSHSPYTDLSVDYQNAKPQHRRRKNSTNQMMSGEIGSLDYASHIVQTNHQPVPNNNKPNNTRNYLNQEYVSEVLPHDRNQQSKGNPKSYNMSQKARSRYDQNESREYKIHQSQNYRNMDLEIYKESDTQSLNDRGSQQSNSFEKVEVENDDSVIDVGIQQDNFEKYTKSDARPSQLGQNSARRIGYDFEGLNDDDLDVQEAFDSSLIQNVDRDQGDGSKKFLNDLNTSYT